MLELNEFQYNTLTASIDSGKLVIIGLHPSSLDSPQRQEVLAKEKKDLYELVHEGILKNISENFEEQIKLSSFNNNRTYSVFTFTELGLKLFGTYNQREIN